MAPRLRIRRFSAPHLRIPRLSASRLRIPRFSLRAKFVVLAVMLAFLVVEPILDAQLVFAARGVEYARYEEIPLVCSLNPGDPENEVARYLHERPAVIDRLLPEGAGGTRFFVDLDDAHGMAFQTSATIGIAKDAISMSRAARVEMHERAHLVEFFAADAVARLMRVIGAPAPDELAADDPGQHFAEMAASAWEVLEAASPAGDYCPAFTPIELLESLESRVPGTAGFVGAYLRDRSLSELGEATVLANTARRLASPYASTFAAVIDAIESRRAADGSLRPWQPPGLRGVLEARREHARLIGGLSGWSYRVQLAGSLLVLQLAGR
jgi:hypothetical protein